MVLLDGDAFSARERVPIRVYEDSEEISIEVARQIADCIRAKAAQGQRCVLGLATGSSPMHVYRELVRLHQHEGLSFANVTTFNLDEYYPMQPDALQSYHRFMHEHLFAHVDIAPENVHIPDGTLPPSEVPRHCREYEAAIVAAGGIDVQLLGLGRAGHVGFNESGSSAASRTRLVTLDKVTRVDAASDFFGAAAVPRTALSVGVGTILDARRLLLLAFGEGKAAAVAAAAEGPADCHVPASFLQGHPDATFFLDYAAAAKLTRITCPWTVGPVAWDAVTTRRAVLWLAGRVRKPLLKLTGDDYADNGLQDLVSAAGAPSALNLATYRALSRTITGWPGGKPPPHAAAAAAPPPASDAADSGPPGPGHGGGAGGGVDRGADGGASPCGGGGGAYPKRVLVMSPHPDDDVISMGGTLIRLLEQGHEVHIAYQTSGNIAVWDEDALRFSDFAAQFAAVMRLDHASAAADVARTVAAALRAKRPGEVDCAEVAQVKTLVRYTEARSAARTCGADVDAHVHFLDMPFYETGKVVKRPLAEDDIGIIVELLDRIRPHQIYAAGDLSDPHGTHRTCLQAIMRALEEVRRREWWAAEAPVVWLYRGAWQEWEPHEIEMAVPLSPDELQRKVEAILRHQSQKDPPLFPGADSREFWQRAQDRNRATAQLYDALGLPEYEGVEAFVRYCPEDPLRLFTPPRPAPA